MRCQHDSILFLFHGTAVIASGLFRYLSAPDGSKGLWFGLVAGSLALVSAIRLRRSAARFADLPGWSALVLVAGWST
jgi:hypothetical protein